MAVKSTTGKCLSMFHFLRNPLISTIMTLLGPREFRTNRAERVQVVAETKSKSEVGAEVVVRAEVGAEVVVEVEAEAGEEAEIMEVGQKQKW